MIGKYKMLKTVFLVISLITEVAAFYCSMQIRKIHKQENCYVHANL